MTRLHVLGLANVPSIAKDPCFCCAYTQKIVKFTKMMHSLPDYEIVFYGCEGSEVDCDEFVEVLPEKTRETVYGPLNCATNKMFDIDASNLAYKTFIKNAIQEIKKRHKPNDILCNPMGNAYGEIVREVGGLACETGIGYTGIVLDGHHVFESSAWMHWILGKYNIENGRNFDTVIPNFFDPDHYTYSNKKEDYFLQISRVIQRKGIQVSAQVCDFLGVPLKIAGVPNESLGIKSDNIEWLGYVGEEEKRDLLAHATALFQPTLYIGPFEGTVVEANLSGTPVITTNHGVFTETVRDGLNGWRCNTFKEFAEAAIKAKHFTRNEEIRKRAIEQYSMGEVRWMYDRYFKQLETLTGKGWYTI